MKKETHFIWVNFYFSTKVQIEETTFTSPTGDGTAIFFTWSSEPSEGLAVCTAKAVPSFLSYLRTLSIGPAQEIEPATSRIVVKRSSADWASPGAVVNGAAMGELCIGFL